MKNIGKRILELRGKTPRRIFAHELDIGTSTLQRYESGERPPDISFVLKLQEVTGCTLDYLLKGEETSYSEKSNLTKEEVLLLNEFGKLSDEQKKLTLGLLISGIGCMNKLVINNGPNGTVVNHMGKE